MRITIEDLEALKELNDELEENHIETEKVMQEDLSTYITSHSSSALLIVALDARDTEIQDQARKIQMLEDACQDLEGTIVQFRELVMQLQSELDSLRSETQTAQHESATAASQTAAMMSLNLKLQSSASKNHAKAIELELRRIEAKETREMLDIVQVWGNADARCGGGILIAMYSPTCPRFMSKPIWTRQTVISSSNVSRRRLTLSIPSLHNHTTYLTRLRDLYRKHSLAFARYGTVYTHRAFLAYILVVAWPPIHVVDNMSTFRRHPSTMRRRLVFEHWSHISRSRSHGEAHRHARRPPTERGVPCIRMRQ